MTTGQRVQRLRELLARIEKLPASTERDRLLSEVRSRAVDVDTDATPRAMLPERELELMAAAVWNPEPATSVSRRPPRPLASTAKPAAPAATASCFPTVPDSAWASEQLSLEDPLQVAPLPHVVGRGGRAVPPWTRGLRA